MFLIIIYIEKTLAMDYYDSKFRFKQIRALKNDPQKYFKTLMEFLEIYKTKRCPREVEHDK